MCVNAYNVFDLVGTDIPLDGWVIFIGAIVPWAVVVRCMVVTLFDSVT